MSKKHTLAVLCILFLLGLWGLYAWTHEPVESLLTSSPPCHDAADEGEHCGHHVGELVSTAKESGTIQTKADAPLTKPLRAGGQESSLGNKVADDLPPTEDLESGEPVGLTEADQYPKEERLGNDENIDDSIKNNFKGTISGTVASSFGSLLEGAAIGVRYYVVDAKGTIAFHDDSYLSEALSDKRGVFVVHVDQTLPKGCRLRVVLRAVKDSYLGGGDTVMPYTFDGPESNEVTVDFVDGDEVRGVRLELLDGVVEGRVVDEEGRGVEGVSVMLRNSETSTDTYGMYRFEQVIAGYHEISIVSHNVRPISGPEEVKVAAHSTVSPIDFTVARLNEIRFRLTDSGGSPLGGRVDVQLDMFPKGIQELESRLVGEDGVGVVYYDLEQGHAVRAVTIKPLSKYWNGMKRVERPEYKELTVDLELSEGDIDLGVLALERKEGSDE